MTYGKWRLWTGHWPMVTHLHGITSKYFKWKADDSGQSLIIIKIKTQWNIYSAPQSICMCVSMSIEHSGCCCVSFERTGYIMCAAVVYMSGNANMWKWWHCFSEIGACECRCWCFVCSFCIVLSGINSLNARKLVWFTLIFVWKFNWIQHKIHSKYTENRFAWFSVNIQIHFFCTQFSCTIFRRKTAADDDDDDDRAYSPNHWIKCSEMVMSLIIWTRLHVMSRTKVAIVENPNEI